MKNHSLIVGLLFSVLISLGAFVNAQAPMPAQVDADYRVQAGDVLFISVWGEKDMQREVLVRPDGGISFPLAGDIVAKDKSVAQIRADITARLTRYIPSPAVDVSIGKVAGNKVFVVGKVNRPGEFVLNSDIDVMQALSMAGGTTVFADLGGIKILRRESLGAEQSVIPFDYKKVSRGERLEMNIRLKAGDTVVVP
ncbi:MAG: polysaccharide biosynthesis/export family protein [Thiotrichales bacterium]